jgi:hypothetical protein
MSVSSLSEVAAQVERLVKFLEVLGSSWKIL